MNWFVLFLICLILSAILLRRLLSRRRLRKVLLFEGTRNLDVVLAAANIWAEALCQDFKPPLTDGDIDAFRETLKFAIATEVHNGGVLPSIGMTGREQMGFVSRLSADAILKSAGKALNESRGYQVDLDSVLPIIEMRIDEEQVKVRPVTMTSRFHDFTVAFKAGDDIETAVAFGRRLRPAVPWSREQLLRGATNSWLSPV